MFYPSKIKIKINSIYLKKKKHSIHLNSCQNVLPGFWTDSWNILISIGVFKSMATCVQSSPVYLWTFLMELDDQSVQKISSSNTAKANGWAICFVLWITVRTFDPSKLADLIV